MLKKLSFTLLLCALCSCSSYQYTQPEFVQDNPEKIIEIKGIANFRNVNALSNTNGKKLKDGLLYRSGNLNGLKTKYFAAFEQLGIKKIIDLRTDDEILKSPDILPKGIAYIHLAAFEDKGDQLNQARSLVLKGKITKGDAERRMLDFYKGYVTEQPIVIKDIIHQVLDANTPVLYHCTAGKDRTGIITALVLKIFKFDDTTIFNEYLSSNNQRQYLIYKRLGKAKRFHLLFPKMDIGVLEKLSWIETAYLKAAFDEIDDKYGSIDNYIHDVLQINETQRQAYIDKFLE